MDTTQLEPTTDVPELARRYAQVRVNRLALDAQAKDLKATEDALAQEFLSAAADQGVKGVKIEVTEDVEASPGKYKPVKMGYTISPKLTTVAKMPQGTDAAIAALKASKKYAYLVKDTVNVQSLGALLREMMGDSKREALPPSFAGVIEPLEVPQVSMVKSSKS